MSIVKGVLEEEYKRLKRLSEKYRKDISRLPVGSLSIKKISGRKYAYLVRRKDKKIFFQYVGSASNMEVKSLQADIKKRKEIEAKLKSIKKDLKELERAIGGRKI